MKQRLLKELEVPRKRREERQAFVRCDPIRFRCERPARGRRKWLWAALRLRQRSQALAQGHARSSSDSAQAPEEQLGAMAAGTLRGLAVAGGGESSDSEDDGWDIGYLDRSSQVVEKATAGLHPFGASRGFRELGLDTWTQFSPSCPAP